MPFPVDISFIEAAEKSLGSKLPDPLRVHLQRDNGGEFMIGEEPWWLFPVWDDSDRKRVSRTANHIVKETELARSDSGLPGDAITIAHDGGGNYLFFKAGTDEFRFWDHETGDEGPVEIEWAQVH
ncbi:MAG: SMI1/KNR4 family protein [Pseudomonadota bacterium]